MRSWHLAVCIAAVVSASPSFAGTTVEVPVDFAIGPSANFIFGPVMQDQLLHTALKIDLFAIIDRETIQKNASRIPPQYRKYANGITEVRLDRPGALKLLPDSIIISPKYKNTGIYGVTFKPIGIGAMAGSGAARLKLDLGLVLTGAYLYSDVLPNTFFARPGLEVKAEVELMASKSFGLGFGWASAFYIPQKLGTFGVGPLNESIWHIGQAYLLLHFRFPYKTSI